VAHQFSASCHTGKLFFCQQIKPPLIVQIEDSLG
jgi:hypothetical protein